MEAVFMKKRDSQSAMIYDEILQRMGPEKRLLKAFELSEFSKQLFICGLKKRHPDISEDEFKKIVIQELIKCHNLNY